MEISELKIWRGGKARWSGEWGRRKQEERKQLVGLYVAKRGKARKGFTGVTN